jgi:hypothetical protein
VRSFVVGHQDFAHDESAIGASGILEDGHWLEDAIGAASFGLAGGAAIEAPIREFFEFGETGELFDLSFAAEVRDGFVTVEPNVFELIFRHSNYGTI